MVLETEAIRLGYGMPTEIDIQTDLLYKVDSIALDAIAKEAIPGCQIMAIKDGKSVLSEKLWTPYV